jgi:hypothetical protein
MTCARARTSCVIALLAVLSCAGCVRPKDPGGHAAETGRTTTAIARPAFEPTSVRVHPLTRLLSDAGRRRIELHLELLDAWNHEVKALGTVVVELYQIGGPGADETGGPMQLRLWTIDLTDPDANSRPYDRVTQTYRLVLADVPEDLPSSEQLELYVRFNTPSGGLLTTSHRLGGME